MGRWRLIFQLLGVIFQLLTGGECAIVVAQFESDVQIKRHKFCRIWLRFWQKFLHNSETVVVQACGSRHRVSH